MIPGHTRTHPKWGALHEQLMAGDIGDVEFTELALEADMPLHLIEQALSDVRALADDHGEIDF